MSERREPTRDLLRVHQGLNRGFLSHMVERKILVYPSSMRQRSAMSLNIKNPEAHRLARELAIDLRSVTGSGPRGRIQATDVETFSTNEPAETSWLPRPGKRVPLVGIRRTIAERMQASFQTAPHITLLVEVDTGQ